MHVQLFSLVCFGFHQVQLAPSTLLRNCGNRNAVTKKLQYRSSHMEVDAAREAGQAVIIQMFSSVKFMSVNMNDKVHA